MWSIKAGVSFLLLRACWVAQVRPLDWGAKKKVAAVGAGGCCVA